MLRPEPDDRGRPLAGPASNVITDGDGTIMPRGADILADALADSLRGYLVVQVVIDDAGHRRTHLYRSAAAAERAVKRATRRGRYAHVSLCQLLPVGVVGGLGGGVGGGVG